MKTAGEKIKWDKTVIMQYYPRGAAYYREQEDLFGNKKSRKTAGLENQTKTNLKFNLRTGERIPYTMKTWR